MRRAALVELVVAMLLLVAATLLYLEWWRTGELEDLNRRVDELERRPAPASSSPRPRRKTPATAKGPPS